jgi:hypothetical protein
MDNVQKQNHIINTPWSQICRSYLVYENFVALSLEEHQGAALGSLGVSITVLSIMWLIARQRLAKHVPERYAVNEDRRPLLDNVFGYHGIAGVSGTTQ